MILSYSIQQAYYLAWELEKSGKIAQAPKR